MNSFVLFSECALSMCAVFARMRMVPIASSGIVSKRRKNEWNDIDVFRSNFFMNAYK